MFLMLFEFNLIEISTINITVLAFSLKFIEDLLS